MVFARLDPALGGELVDLALRDHAGGAGENLQHLEAAVLHHQLEAARKQEIADQHARGIAPDDVGRPPSAPQARSIDHVVVEQGGGVDELHRGGELVMARALIIEQTRAGQRQHRPHPLAAAGDQVPGKLGDQRHLALHAIEDHGIHMIEIGGDQLDHRIERGRARSADGMDGGSHRLRSAPRPWQRQEPATVRSGAACAGFPGGRDRCAGPGG